MNPNVTAFYKQVMLLKRKAEQHMRDPQVTRDPEAMQNASGYLDAINDVVGFLGPLTR